MLETNCREDSVGAYWALVRIGIRGTPLVCSRGGALILAHPLA